MHQWMKSTKATATKGQHQNRFLGPLLYVVCMYIVIGRKIGICTIVHQ